MVRITKGKNKQNREIVAVIFDGGLYQSYGNVIYRQTFDRGPIKTTFTDLKHILETREGSIPIYEGESISIQF